MAIRVSGILIGIKGGKASVIDSGDWNQMYLKARDLSENGIPKEFDLVEAWERPNEAYSEDGSRKGQLAALEKRNAERAKVAEAERLKGEAKHIADLEAQLAEAKGEKPAEPEAAPAPKKKSSKS